MDTKLAIVKRTHNCFSRAEEYFKRSFLRPHITFDIRGQDCGRAYFPLQRKYSYVSTPAKLRLAFNTTLLDENFTYFIEQVVPHECAHLLAYQIYGSAIKPHGNEWKALMLNLFHLEPMVRHNLDVRSVQMKPYVYSCSCRGKWIDLSTKQHNNIKKGSVYLCKNCQSELKFSYEKEKKPKKEKNTIDLLYLYLTPDFNFNKDYVERLERILNKKKPKTIITSKGLNEDLVFKQWLKSKHFITKYQGPIEEGKLTEDFMAKVTHCILITHHRPIEERFLWLSKLNENHAFIRTLLIH